MSSRGASYEEKIARLKQMVESAENAGFNLGGVKCTSSLLVAGACVPLVMFLFFFFMQPSVVMKKEGTKFVRDNSQVFKWTIYVTLVVWIAMYAYTYCSNYNSPIVCSI